jgi:hypothetical protein
MTGKRKPWNTGEIIPAYLLFDREFSLVIEKNN